MRFNIAAISLALLAGAWAQTELPTLADRQALLSFSEQNPDSYVSSYENGYAVFRDGKPIAIADAGLADEMRPDIKALAKTRMRRAVPSGGSSGAEPTPLDPSDMTGAFNARVQIWDHVRLGVLDVVWD
ncbi:hypothetical protein BDZ85DRAFT_286268 [Elsinoe ampelina]|uniref:Uncharacterized protein n=1 Tax=Elsinoe ampelina TaxID=302913 RepID=A0A6A6FZ22_9PEZI|nr:hypothetical protein BDZ85DRAFT_286268 [Elsinoe ampelina]